MKKIVILWLTTMMIAPLWGQQSYSGHHDAVVFSGLIAQPQNLNTYAYYYGTYLDYLPIKSKNEKWIGGIWVVASKSKFIQNLQRYNGKELKIGTGIAAGYYDPNFSQNSQLFIGFNLGLVYDKNQGESVSTWGKYTGKQENLLLTGDVNINILRQKIKAWFPRTQLQLSNQNPLMARKKSYWNDTLVVSKIWNMAYYQALFKESLVNLEINSKRKNYLSPKLILFSSFGDANKEINYGGGGEISFHHGHQDDFLAVYYLYKFSTVNKDVFVVGINLNFGLIKNKR